MCTPSCVPVRPCGQVVVRWSGPLEGQRLQPQLAAALPQVRTLGDPVVGDAGVPLLERDDELGPGQVHAKAAVDACAEPDVVVEVSAEHVELVWVLELAGVAVRRR